MKSQTTRSFWLFLFIPGLFLVASCTAGGGQFTGDTPASFWYGLWHGVIAFISLVIHLFNDTVLVYERNNTGGWYDFGFLLGVVFVWGGGCHVKCKSAARKKHDQEWEEIGEKVEIKVMHRLKDWAEKEDSDATGSESKEDWDELWRKSRKNLSAKFVSGRRMNEYELYRIVCNE